MAEAGVLCNLLNTSGICALWIKCQGFYKEFMTVTENCPFNEFTSSNHRGFYRTGHSTPSQICRHFQDSPREQEMGSAPRETDLPLAQNYSKQSWKSGGIVLGVGREGM